MDKMIEEEIEDEALISEESAERVKENIVLKELLDLEEVQLLMDKLNTFIDISMAIIDLKGNVLVRAGWRNLCTKFHRKNPRTRKHCIESDTVLTAGISSGDFKLYRCKNNLWDMVVPIIVEDKKLGNLFIGQFILKEEGVDYELFIEQAKKFNFDREKYLEALERVPRLSRGEVKEIMDLYTDLTHLISRLGRQNRTYEKSLNKQKSLLERLADSRNHLLTTFNSISEGLIVTDKEGLITRMNPRAEELTGWELSSARGKKFYEVFKIVNSRTNEKVEDPVKKVLQEGKIIGLANDTTLISKTDQRYHIADGAAPIKNEGGDISGVVVVFSDITEKYQVRNQLKQSEEKYRRLVESTNAVLWEYDFVDEKWSYIAPQIESILGYKSEEWTDLDFWFEKIHQDDRQRAKEKFNKHISRCEDHVLEYRINKKDGSTIWLKDRINVETEAGQVGRISGFIIDITERKQAERDLRHLAFHDQLTSLHNRSYLEKRMNEFEQQDKSPFGVIMADLNGLKLINDTYGHLTGDEVLKATADVLHNCARKRDIIGRWSGDEFVVLMPDTGRAEARKMYQCIKEAFSNKVITVDEELGEEIPVSVALGVSVKDKNDQNIYQTLKFAEDRMHDNKRTESTSTRSNILNTLLNTLGQKSSETKEHANRMRRFARELGRELDLPHFELDKLSLLANLHDIGKTIISEDILNKPGKLNEEEWEKIKEHPRTGNHIAAASREFAHIAEEILSHHERWDGGGYPRGLKGKNIPLLARIISIVDAYDVMTNGRPYKEPISREEALKELQRNAGTQFDPQLVEKFVEIMGANKK